MAAMGRSLIADPFMPAKAKAGKEDEVVHCIACCQGCFDNVFKLEPVTCLCNPAAGYEKERAVEKTNHPRKVMVIGGGAVGVETAMHLAEKGTLSGEEIKFLLIQQAETPETLLDLATKGSKEVVIVEMLDKISTGIGKSTKWVMHQDMAKQRLSSMTGTTALEITPDHVRVQRGDEINTLPADTVVLAAGATPVNSLEACLKEKGIEYKVVGDASGIALAFDAVHQGYEAGRSI